MVKRLGGEMHCMRQIRAVSSLAALVWAVALSAGAAPAEPAAAGGPRARSPAEPTVLSSPEEQPAGEQAAPTGTDRARRHGWTTRGPRVGFLYPVGGSYAGARRLTSLAFAYRYQTPAFDVESVPLTGIAWGGDLRQDGGTARAWTILDLYLTWTPARGDFAPYAGVGLGLRALRLERDGRGGAFWGVRDESAMALCFGLGSGLALFRTYDFQVAVDLRYERVMDGFAGVGGGGAHGLALTFGLQHR